jgi:hypothetical protein
LDLRWKNFNFIINGYVPSISEPFQACCLCETGRSDIVRSNALEDLSMDACKSPGSFSLIQSELKAHQPSSSIPAAIKKTPGHHFLSAC